MNFKALLGSLVIGSSTSLTIIPTTAMISANSIIAENYNNSKLKDTYNGSFKEINKMSFYDEGGYNLILNKNDVVGASNLPSNFWLMGDSVYLNVGDHNISPVFSNICSVYGVSVDTPISEINNKMQTMPIVNVSISFSWNGGPYNWVLSSFSGSLKPKPPKDNIPLPDHTTNFSGTYNYSDIIKNLDYLMIKRQDFDKFDYSYLYWVPVFNFLYETQMDRHTSISVEGLAFKNVSMELIIADETKLQADRIIRFTVDDNIFELKTDSLWAKHLFDFDLTFKGVKYETKLFFLSESDYYQFFNDFLHVFFGNITYMKNNYNFLRYDTYLQSDFFGFMNYWIPKINTIVGDSDWFKNYVSNDMFTNVYSVLGDFFYCMFYATFDMDPSTRVKVDFNSDSDSWKDKGYYFEIGFLYRSLITFYPKQYLFNGSYEGVNNHILFRSFYFLTDEKIHNDFISGKTNYYISFNVLKMYDNLMFNLPTSASSSAINRFDANFDVQYGINIFTVSFPLLTTITEKPQYTFYVNDFNILNSTAFIPDNPDDRDGDLIPVPDCYATLLSASGWACILKQTSIRVINFLAKVTGLNMLLKPMVSIAQTVLSFFSSSFDIFHAVPAFQYLFQFMLGFSLFVIIFRFFV